MHSSGYTPPDYIPPDYSPILRSWMQQAGIPSFRALGRQAGVSRWQIAQLRRGQVAQMRVEVLLKFSQALHISLVDLLETFAIPTMFATESPSATSTAKAGRELDSISKSIPSDAADHYQQEYQRLQQQLTQQKVTLQQEFQRTTLRILESWVTQFPSLVHAAQQNPNLSAKPFLVFRHPIEQLLKTWGIEAISPVGAEVDYDPQLHQLEGGTAQPGDKVMVRYVGYRQGETLLYRARVRPIHHED